MPYAIIDGPPIKDLDVKRALVKEITDAIEKAFKLPRETYTVLLKENTAENVGVGGRLVIDRREE